MWAPLSLGLMTFRKRKADVTAFLLVFVLQTSTYFLSYRGTKMVLIEREKKQKPKNKKQNKTFHWNSSKQKKLFESPSKHLEKCPMALKAKREPCKQALCNFLIKLFEWFKIVGCWLFSEESQLTLGRKRRVFFSKYVRRGLLIFNFTFWLLYKSLPFFQITLCYINI